jgi:hypothetical protein
MSGGCGSVSVVVPDDTSTFFTSGCTTNASRRGLLPRLPIDRSLALARGQGARWWDLRAATSLARLSREARRARGAEERLASLVEGIREGFDTADWGAARALAARQ